MNQPFPWELPLAPSSPLPQEIPATPHNASLTPLMQRSTVSIPGSSSRGFDTCQKEIVSSLPDEDDLLVPSTNAFNIVNPANVLSSVMINPSVKSLPQASSAKKTFSVDFDSFLEQSSLPVFFSHPSSLSSSSSSSMPVEFELSEPINTTSLLNSDWINTCMDASDFEKILNLPLEEQPAAFGQQEEFLFEEMASPLNETFSAPQTPSTSPPKVSKKASVTKAKTKSKKDTSVPPSTPKPPTSKPDPEDKEALERYMEFRKYNNEAAVKSRARRKEKERQNQEMVEILKSENVRLQKELFALQNDFKKLNETLQQFLSKSN